MHAHAHSFANVSSLDEARSDIGGSAGRVTRRVTGGVTVSRWELYLRARCCQAFGRISCETYRDRPAVSARWRI